MTTTTKEIVDVIVDHPLEKVFNLPDGSTIMPVVQRTTEMTSAEAYDGKDKEIEEQYQEIYDAAMSAFENQFQEADQVEGRYKARSGEVAVQFLQTALNAAQAKSTTKMHKDKLSATIHKAPGTVNNNLIVADRNELLRDLRNLDLEKKLTP
jgi:hypothetical protein